MPEPAAGECHSGLCVWHPTAAPYRPAAGRKQRVIATGAGHEVISILYSSERMLAHSDRWDLAPVLLRASLPGLAELT